MADNRKLFARIETDPTGICQEELGGGSGALLANQIPAHMHAGLMRYILTGVRPGQFLSAVVEGNLFEALARGDEQNIKALRGYGIFLRNAAPGGCYGHPEVVKEWIKDGGLIGLRGVKS